MLIIALLDKTIKLADAVHWVKANPGQTGMYRVNYDMSNWNQFVTMLRSDHTVSCVCAVRIYMRTVYTIIFLCTVCGHVHCNNIFE